MSIVVDRCTGIRITLDYLSGICVPNETEYLIKLVRFLCDNRNLEHLQNLYHAIMNVSLIAKK